MSNVNPSFGNVAPGQRFYNGQLLSRGGNATQGRINRREVPGRPVGFSGMPGGIQRMPGQEE